MTLWHSGTLALFFNLLWQGGKVDKLGISFFSWDSETLCCNHLIYRSLQSLIKVSKSHYSSHPGTTLYWFRPLRLAPFKGAVKWSEIIVRNLGKSARIEHFICSVEKLFCGKIDVFAPKICICKIFFVTLRPNMYNIHKTCYKTYKCLIRWMFWSIITKTDRYGDYGRFMYYLTAPLNGADGALKKRKAEIK